jgi:hypothetical protein
MSEHDIEPFPPELGELLDAARELPAVSTRHRLAVHARLASTLGLGGPNGPNDPGDGSSGPPPVPSGPAAPVAPAPPSIPPIPPASSALASPSLVSSAGHAALVAHPFAVVVGTFLVGALAGAGLHAGFVASSPKVQEPTSLGVIANVAASTAAPSASAIASALASTIAPSPASAAAPVAANAGPSAKASGSVAHGPLTAEPGELELPTGKDVGLGAERALLDVARTAVGRGQPAAALSALRRHAATFPQGRLREEREALFVQALALNGQSAEAERRANGFRHAYPDSFLGSAVAAAASGAATTSAGTAASAPTSISVTDPPAAPKPLDEPAP